MRNYKSTSLHCLNSDTGLPFFKKFLWFLLNILNNSAGKYFVDKNIIQKTFPAMINVNDNVLIDYQESPARVLSNYFWRSLDWFEISDILKNKIYSCEMGCGSGVYGKKLKKLAGDSFGSYIGIDLFPDKNWNQDNCKDELLSFVNDNSDNIDKYLKNENFIFTQSALEHFENDLLYFKHISTYVNKIKHPVIQVHLMPSAACLFTYLLHGLRQYTPRNISKITRLFPTSKILLYSLGSNNCNRIHKEYITIPHILKWGDKRKSSNEHYKLDLVNAINADSNERKLSPTSFYALIICSNVDSDFNILGINKCGPNNNI